MIKYEKFNFSTFISDLFLLCLKLHSFGVLKPFRTLKYHYYSCQMEGLHLIPVFDTSWYCKNLPSTQILEMIKLHFIWNKKVTQEK
jgi:hypothetical protein